MVIVSFNDFATPLLGKGVSKIAKLKEAGLMNNYLKIMDENPVIRTFEEEYIKDIIENVLTESEYIPRFMTITIAPNVNEFKVDDQCLSRSHKPGTAYQKQLWDSVLNKFKKYECSYAGCFEYHKYRPRIRHMHIMYISKNLNRVRNLKKAIREIVGKTRTSIKDEQIKNGIKNVTEYICKADDNNINKVNSMPEHEKEYSYWLKK
jgi:uncharacterized protein YjgD (DUF1641 family)